MPKALNSVNSLHNTKKTDLGFNLLNKKTPRAQTGLTQVLNEIKTTQELSISDN